MGGSGSGNWYRWSKKSTTNDYLRLDIKFIKKHNNLSENIYSSNSISWSRGGKETASIGYKVDTLNLSKPFIRLVYNNKDEPLDYKVELATTTPNYGGKRWWFLCPASGCGRRVSVLYGGRIFACRHCYNLAYDSQNEAPHYRYLSKAQHIHEKLGGSGCTDEYTPKPKGMHWKTYNRLMNELEHYDSIALIEATKRFGSYL